MWIIKKKEVQINIREKGLNRLFLPIYTVYLVMQVLLTIYEFKKYKKNLRIKENANNCKIISAFSSLQIRN